MLKVLVGCSLVCVAAAQATASSDVDAANVERWADEVFQQALSEQRFTGAVVSVVKDGTVILSKGYGQADREAGTPMDPARTIVRVCSLSKTIVATALVQLVDRRAIASLDDPANKYLKRIQLPSFNGRQITLRHLTTHSAGFEDSFFNAGTDEVVPTPVDSRTLQRLIPRIVREPGTLSVYSNASAALQGVVIEDITGLTLREYLAKNIFAPLGMTGTVLNDNPPAPASAARPYVLYENRSVRPVGLVAKHPLYAPSGGVYSTAQDMTRFLLAHLDAGRSAAQPILSPAAFTAMHTLTRRNHPGIAGLGVQFFIDDINGQRVLSHGCGLPGFTSYLVMLPERNVGMFVSVISARGREPLALLNCCGQPVQAIAPNFATRFFYLFLEEFVGYGGLPAQPLAVDLARYLGDYRVERRGHTSILAALDLLAADSAVVPVRRGDDGALMIGGRGPFLSYRQGVLQRDMHPARIYAFDFGSDGRALRMMWSSAQAATRVSYWQNPTGAVSLLQILSITMLTGLIALAWPAAAQRTAWWSRWLPLLGISSFAAAWAIAKLGFPAEESIEEYINLGRTARLYLIATACNLVAAAAIAMGAIAIVAWRRSFWGQGMRGIARRAHFSVLAVAALLFIPVFAAFHLLGWQIP